MNSKPTVRVIGAFIVGFALVAGAYVTTNFGPSDQNKKSQNIAVTERAPIRSAIAVTDNDGNGVEDWRDEFFTAVPAITTETNVGTPYVPPETLTGQLGITFIEDIVRSRNTGGAVGGDDTEVIARTIETLQAETAVAIYDTVDITIIPSTDATAIRTYGNTIATAILENNQTDLDYELFILQDILNRGDKSRLAELQTLAQLHRLTRDALLTVPVPATFAKPHLDLINTIHALQTDIDGMTYTFSDPAFALLRLKRYEDNLLGLVLALENMYSALVPYADQFTTADPALYFAQFNPNTSRVNRLRI